MTHEHEKIKDMEERLKTLLRYEVDAPDQNRMSEIHKALIESLPAPKSIPFWKRFRFLVPAVAALSLLLVVVTLLPEQSEKPKDQMFDKLSAVIEDDAELNRMILLLEDFTSTESISESPLNWESTERFAYYDILEDSNTQDL